MIAVKVVDENNKIVVGAKVTINGVTAITDKSGVASFTNIPAGDQKAKIEYDGKKFEKLIKVKGVSNTLEPQAFSVKPAESGPGYVRYAIVAGAMLLGVIIIYLIIKNIKKPKDHHMDGAPISGSPMGPSQTMPPGVSGPTNIGSVVGPSHITQGTIENNDNGTSQNGQY
jgi:hypothetical protein